MSLKLVKAEVKLKGTFLVEDENCVEGFIETALSQEKGEECKVTEIKILEE